MRLRDLGATFIRHEERMQEGQFVKPGIDPARGNFTEDDFVTEVRPTRYMVPVETLAEAHGIRFGCPQCFGKDQPHGVVCWFEGKVPDDLGPKPGRWTPSGTGLDDLTFVPGKQVQAVSVQLLGGCGWHGFVKNGDAA